MQDPAAVPTPPPPAPADTAAAPAAAEPFASDLALARESGAARVRWSIYFAFVLLALAVVAQGWNMLRVEADREREAVLVEAALQQRRAAHRTALLAAQAAGRPAQQTSKGADLAALLQTMAGDEKQLQDLLAAHATISPDAAERATPSLQAWLAASETLRRRGRTLLQGMAAGAGGEVVAQAALAAEDAAEEAGNAAQSLIDTLRAASHHRSHDLERDIVWSVGFVLALLCGLGVLAVEPTARAVRRHGQRLGEQATELQRLALVAEHTSAMVLITDATDAVVWANAAFGRMTGLKVDEVIGRRTRELTNDPHVDPGALARWRQAIRSGSGARLEWLHRTPGGRDIWLDVDLRPLRNAQGELTGYLRVCTDITARVQQQAKLKALWAALPAGVVVQAANGEVLDTNRAAERMLGVSCARLRELGREVGQWRPARADGTPYHVSELPSMRTLATGEAVRNETVGVRTPHGEWRWLLLNTEPQLDAHANVTGVVTCFIDVSESRALQERLVDSARTDALTRLPNRSVVMERLQRALAHARRAPGYGFAVLFMDFDRFKQVNDTLGHGAGDELLRQIARRLDHSLRPGDALARLDAGADEGPVPAVEADGGDAQVAARLGGDEFVVVLEGVRDETTVAVIAQRLLEEVAEPYTIGPNPVHASASIGVVLCVGGTPGELPQDAEEVLRNADTAMYEAKRAGRSRWVLFDDSMQKRVMRALALENDLRRALVNDELYAVYQPVVDLQTLDVVGVEALVRWRHPVRGLVPPSEFIGAAEECGLIDAVGETVLRMACSQFVAWQTAMPAAAPRLLAVNLSRAQLERPGLVADVAAVLSDCRMDPARLQLEVTESLAAQDDHVQQTLRELKALGVRLALDDFGTGYSSLACLHQMPVDTVKIDRSFVQHAETVEYHRVLIEATIRVARTLGMTTVAEGIETAGQAALMRELDCDRGQGYLFSRPLEPADLERWARGAASRRRHTAAGRAEAVEAEIDTVM